ncbi:MAG: PAS domain-containing protein [Polyangiaceae bacterium]|nr:PAS domain-containing protein [Polyangiaceae bacterium]
MGRRHNSLIRIATPENAGHDRELLDAIAGGSADPQVVFSVLEGGELALAWVNQAAKHSGLLMDPDALGSGLDDVLVAECAVSLRDAYPESLRVRERYAYEQFVTMAGVETWWMTTLVPLLDADGTARWLVATFLKLDFVRRTEAALRRSEANLRELIGKSPDAAIVCRPDGEPVYANPAAISVFGPDLRPAPPPDGARPRTFYDLIPAAARDGLRAVIDAALQGDSPVPLPFELRASEPDEDAVVLELHAIRLVFDGEPGVLLSARDVSQLRQVQASLALTDRLVALGRMAAGVAHEINNPLAYVQANLQFAAEELERLQSADIETVALSLSESLAALREASEGADRVRAIVRDLRGLSQLDPGPRRPTALTAVVETALKLAGSEIKSRGLLTRSFGPVPPVLAHEPRLVQVFLNLLLNAAYALDGRQQEAPEIRIAIGTDPTGRAFVEIVDTGTGIRDADLPRLFDPFFTTRAPGEGLGLGLSVCHQIISALGGRIDVESRFGVGSTFRVILPAASERS